MNLNNLPNSKEECDLWMRRVNELNQKLIFDTTTELRDRNEKLSKRLEGLERLSSALRWEPRLRAWYIDESMVDFLNIRMHLPEKG